MSYCGSLLLTYKSFLRFGSVEIDLLDSLKPGVSPDFIILSCFDFRKWNNFRMLVLGRKVLDRKFQLSTLFGGKIRRLATLDSCIQEHKSYHSATKEDFGSVACHDFTLKGKTIG